MSAPDLHSQSTDTAVDAAALFDLTDEQLRTHTSSKWSLVSGNVLPAWIAEMDVMLAPAITRALQQALDRQDAGYPGRPDGVVGAFTDFAADRWGWRPHDRDVSVHVDIATAGTLLMQHYSDDEGRVLIMPPVYNGFYEWLKEGDLIPVEVPLQDVSEGGRMDLEGVEEALASGTRVILLCSPHNPVGRVFTREELAELAQVAQRQEAVVIADEIHAPLVYPGTTPFTPWFSVSDAARATGIALHAATKPFNFAGLKCGLAVRSPDGPWPAHLRSARSLIEAGHWGLLATEAAYRDGGEWLDAVVGHIQQQATRLPQLLAEHLPGVKCHPPEVSFLAWLDFRGAGLYEDPAAYFEREAHVKLSPGESFGATRGFARLNLGTSAERLDRIFARMGEAWPPASPA